MSANDYGRRLDKLTEALGASQRDPFRPERVLQVIFCQHWYDEGSLEARDELAQYAIARQSTVDQVVEWVAEDARRHRYDLPYMLVLQFMAD
ncbi:MAG TPA: hypothetical protein VGS80_11290, partial [Ktedonobacterales bacterium]|nr:hypothetical protein [Ktedonobacterales bacterium]